VRQVNRLAKTFEFEALLNVLKRSSLITRGEVLEEIARLQQKAGGARKEDTDALENLNA